MKIIIQYKMKKLLVFSMVLVSFVSYGQTYKFDRVFADGMFLKMSGTINITDSSVNIVQNGVVSNIPATTTSKAMVDGKLHQQLMYKSEMVDIRFNFAPNSPPTRNENYLLIYEQKDKFTNTISSMMYLLKE